MYKPIVTIAVSVYNEEENIKSFLESVIVQKEEGFKIDAIWIHNDGSTDTTSQIIKSLNYPKIKLWDHKKREGKATWLNQIYKNLTTDFLVQTDADVIFAHKYVVRDITKPLMSDPKIGMTGGNPEPLEGNTFWERTCKIAFEPYQEFRSEIRGGNNAFSSIGQLLAFRKAVVKKIKVPEDMVTNDIYTYFCCLTLGYKYRFVNTAKVFYRAPQNLRDLIKQNTRFPIGIKRMYSLFNPQLVKKELNIPKRQLYKKLLTQFFKHPLYATVYYLINSYCRISTELINIHIDAKWPMAQSTKNLRLN